MAPASIPAWPAVWRRRRCSCTLSIFLLLIVFTGRLAGAAPIGEPTASAPKRHIQAATEFDYSLRSVERSGSCCLDSESVRLLLSVAGRVHERVELFGRLGGVLMQTLAIPGGPDANGSANVAIGGGVKVTLYERGPVAWGAGGQILFHETKDDNPPTTISWHELDFFAGPVIAARPDVHLYGGLLGAVVMGELDATGGGSRLGAFRPLGVFFGGRADVTRAAFFGLELRLIDEVSVASRVGVIF
jgi:hypothetical protein